jgi:hypothetical protein
MAQRCVAAQPLLALLLDINAGIAEPTRRKTVCLRCHGQHLAGYRYGLVEWHVLERNTRVKPLKESCTPLQIVLDETPKGNHA